MEAAIAWLVQTILATLLIDKLEAWIQRVGLADDVEKLKTEIRRVGMVVSALKGRSIGNEPLAQSLARLKELLYEADDVVDELDYYRLQQQVQGVIMDEPQGMRGAERVDDISSSDVDTPMNSSVGKLRSVVWEHFMITEKCNGRPIKAKCTYCTEEFKCQTKTNGTSSMKKHLENAHSLTCTKKPPGLPHQQNPSSSSEPIAIGSSSGKKGKKRRSKAWGLVDIIEEEHRKPIKARCKYCPTEINCGASNGTGSILNHYKICKKKPGSNDQPSNPSSIADASASAMPTVVGDSSSRKRRRAYEGSAQITAANTHTPWDKAIYSNMIQKITNQLQEGRAEVSEVLKLHGSESVSSSKYHQSKGLDQHLRISSFAPRKVYGRVAEKNSIIKMITEDESDCVAVLPIVSIAGVGKTVLAQLVYNDLDVKKLFHHRVWVWVSRNFDEVRLTREMLDFIPQERTEVHGESHERISSFAKLQEILASRANSKKLLFILDGVWDDMTDGRWENLLKPIKSGCANGSVILVTTRDVSVAKMTGTTEQIKLGALEHDEFRLLFKLHAFGDDKYMGEQNLCDIGQKIAERLKGNPLAAESTGKILKAKLNTDRWNDILKNEDWKSLQLSGGIMTALKLSYDQLPFHSQQCFAYCSIFPNGYQFTGGELASKWISQGFVKGSHASKDIEQNYLIQLVNLGFFEQVERETSSTCSQTCYAVCGLMHDFGRIVSLPECATIDGLQCNKMSPAIRHLSIVTDSEYRKDEHGSIPRIEMFEKNLRDTVTSVSKLRTLVLLGHYDSYFLQLLQDIFRKAHNLRFLQISATSTFPQVLNRLYHLQVLDVGSHTDPIIPDGINNLVSLRHLVVHKGLCTSIATMGSMTSLHEPHDFKIQISSNFEITQPQSTSELVQDWVHQLDNVKTLKEVYETVLKKNEVLEKLHLSRKESYAETVMELLPIDESDPSSEPSIDTAREVLAEGFEPRLGVKILEIWYSGAASPIGFDSNRTVISLEALHLYGCREWQIYPSFEKFPFLTTLKLGNLPKVTEVLVPALEELVLVDMSKLERCSCTSVRDLSSRLRALQIEKCRSLKVFDLFEKYAQFEIEQRPWLPCLQKLTLRDCPHLEVLNPLPPSTTCSELLITRVSILPSMNGSFSEMLHIGYFDEYASNCIDEYSDELRILDNKILAFNNLTNLKSMRLVGCRNLSYISLEGFSQLHSLKSLQICRCSKFFSSDMMPEYTLEDVTAANCKAFPSLQSLNIEFCKITGKWLSLLMRHAAYLEELHLKEMPSGKKDDASTGLATEGLVHISSNIISSLKKITIRYCPRLTFNWGEEGFSAFTSLQELTIWGCREMLSSLVYKGELGGQVWLLPTSLEELDISSYSQEMLQPCFPRNLTSLRKLKVWSSLGLKSLQLHSCPKLEELTIQGCISLTAVEGLQSLVSLRRLEVSSCPVLPRWLESFSRKEVALEGLQSLGSLRHLRIYECPGLPPYLESFSRQVDELFARLETLEIDDPSVLTMSFCNHLTSLQGLKLHKLELMAFQQEISLVLLKSLQLLEFNSCFNLVDLPAGLHLLPSLKRLKIFTCGRVSRLPETGLPHSLVELDIYQCNNKLTKQCRGLGTRKLRVKIDGEWLVL